MCRMIWQEYHVGGSSFRVGLLLGEGDRRGGDGERAHGIRPLAPVLATNTDIFSSIHLSFCNQFF